MRRHGARLARLAIGWPAACATVTTGKQDMVRLDAGIVPTV